MLFIRIKLNLHILGNSLYQATKQQLKYNLNGEKQWKIRWRRKTLSVFGWAVLFLCPVLGRMLVWHHYVFESLHWVTIPHKIEYKINTVCHKCLYVHCSVLSVTVFNFTHPSIHSALLCFWYFQPPDSWYQTFHCCFPHLFCLQLL